MIIETGKCGDNVTYVLTNEYELILTGTGPMYDYTSIDTVYYDKADAKAADEYLGHVVPWYNYIKSIKYLTISEGITYIGNRAFWKCSNIVGDLVIPSTVSSIGDYAFEGCSGFDGTLTITSALKTIGVHAFRNCYGLTGSLVLPDSITYIGKSAFSKCSGFTGAITIPSSMTIIEPYTFEYCSGFDKPLVIPSNIVGIGNGAFNGCTGLTGKLEIPSTVTVAGAMTFAKCGSDEHINERMTYTNLGELSFYKCNRAIPYVIVSDTITSIGYDAFYGCDMISSIMLPSSIAYIGRDAFKGLAEYSVIYMYGEIELIAGKYDVDKTALAFVNGNGYKFFHNIMSMPATVYNAPRKDGYVFGGWYADEEFTGSPITMLVNGMTYYPKWIQV